MAVRHGFADLARSLPVDVEQDIVTGREPAFHFLPAGALVVVKYQRVLQECVLINQVAKFGLVDKIITTRKELNN